jgi:hypothetical protein
MSFKVFLSYSAERDEQPIVWRLQTLAAAHGIQIYVPTRGSLRASGAEARGFPAEAMRREIDSCDCVLGILTSRISAAVERELSYALGKNKLIIPIVAEGINHSGLLKKFPAVFRFSPWSNPGEVETKVVEFLKKQKLDKENRQALGALVGIGLGLLLLSAAKR